MEEVTEGRILPFKGEYESGATNLFVGQVQECHNALPEVNMSSTLSINVEGFGLARKLEHHPVKVRTEARGGNRNALRIRKSTQAVPRE